jgi:hypothetical protein
MGSTLRSLLAKSSGKFGLFRADQLPSAGGSPSAGTTFSVDWSFAGASSSFIKRSMLANTSQQVCLVYIPCVVSGQHVACDVATAQTEGQGQSSDDDGCDQDQRAGGLAQSPVKFNSHAGRGGLSGFARDLRQESADEQDQNRDQQAGQKVDQTLL